MQKSDYELIYKRGKLTLDERHRLETEIRQGLNLPNTDTPSIAIARAHREMEKRLAREYADQFITGVKAILDCEPYIDEIRAHLQEEGIKIPVDILEGYLERIRL